MNLETLNFQSDRQLFRNLLQLVTIRQFPPADKSLPPLNKSKWWIPTATKVLALINAANNSCSPTIIEYTEFYNIALDHMDLMKVAMLLMLVLVRSLSQTFSFPANIEI